MKNAKVITSLAKLVDAKTQTGIWPILSVFIGFLAIYEAIQHDSSYKSQTICNLLEHIKYS